MNKRILCIISLIIITLLLCSSCTKSNNTSFNSEESKQDVTSGKESEKNLEVYGGPGKDYIKLNNISRNEIKDYLKFEDNWIEIDYGSKRGYISANEVEDVDMDKIPHVVNSVNSNVYPYPILYNSKISINLFDEANVYYKPKSSETPTEIDKNNTVTILCSESNSLKTYIQIEFENEKGKRRGYCESSDLLSLNNPLLNFNDVKQKNACVTYNGKEYYSATGEVTSLSNGWHKKEEMSIGKTDVDWVAGITGVIAGNDINEEAIKSTEGKLQLYSSKDRRYINANISNESAENKIGIADFIMGSTMSFIDSGVEITNLDIRFDDYNGEQRIVIKTGSPIEFSKAGKETDLSTLIVEKNNTALTLVESKKRADEKIKNMYPDLDKEKTYSMHMTFSNDFEGNNYGYYIVIDSNCDVYAVPIIHPGTSFIISSEDGFVCDAAWDLATAMIKVDDESKEKILTLLADNGFAIDGFKEHETDTNIPDSSFEYNGHHYNFYQKECDTWEDAETYCENKGGHLAIIDSENENNKLYDFMKSVGYESAYFGLTDVEKEGVWKNVDGTDPKFVNWSDGEPNNERGIENYAMFYYKSPEYQWNDGDFMHGTINDPAIFICEWDY